jgi:hypothetical protein
VEENCEYLDRNPFNRRADALRAYVNSWVVRDVAVYSDFISRADYQSSTPLLPAAVQPPNTHDKIRCIEFCRIASVA